MPLPEKARVEAYVPDLLSPAYQSLLDAIATLATPRSTSHSSHFGEEIPSRLRNSLSTLVHPEGQVK